MKARLRCCVLPAALALGTPAMAQPAPMRPSESITVTGIKDVDKAVTKFVGEMTVPTRMAGKLARWQQGVCPITAGLRPEIAKFVSQHVRDVAAQVGAPVNRSDKCQPNIEIVFTTTPQGLLDHIRVLYPHLLGYHDNSAQAEKLAAVTHPIQSWYSTATVDLHGNAQMDGVRTGGVTLEMPFTPGDGGGGGIQTSATGTVAMNMPDARVVSVTGGRLSDGVSSGLNHVVVAAEPAKLLEFEIGTLADFIAMLALAQTQLPETCQELPTILNLLVPGCDAPPKALTGVDLAYLRGLYKMTATANFRGQRSEIVYQMDKSLGAGQ